MPLHEIFALVFAALAACGIGYSFLAILGARRFLRSSPAPAFFPPVSILKPLKGSDPEMYEAFRSHCLQDYPESYEIIFGVNSKDDPAVKQVERLKQEFPHRSIQLIVCKEVRGTNRKVNNLAQMLRSAQCEFILINDSDIRVAPDYLRRVCGHFRESTTGMVTALYRGVPHGTIWSRMEALTIATDFAGGVLSAQVVERGIRFALGSTLAIRRSVLHEIGGFDPLLNYLADDYELGCRTAEAGHKVVLAKTVVETHLHPYTFGEMFRHQLRWSRTVRDRRKLDYLGLIFTFGIPWAIASVVFSFGAWWSVAVLGAVLLARYFSAVVLTRPVLHDSASLRNLWLIPARDVLALGIWLVSFFGSTIEWRGEKFRLKHGKLERLKS